MRRQILTRSSNLFIFIVVFSICGLQGMSYADLEFTEGEETAREIAENSPSGTNIGDPLRYAAEGIHNCHRVILEGPDASAFSVARLYRAVQLKTKSALDYETQDFYTVMVTIYGGEFSDTIEVAILVTDVDETQPNRPPVFSAASTTRAIAENTPADRDIGAPVSAIDPDRDTLTYNLKGTDAESFNIDASNGQLKTKAALDHDAKRQYSVTVEVSDGKGGTDSINVSIHVTRVSPPEPIMFLTQNGVVINNQTVTVGTFQLGMDFDRPVTGFEPSELGIDDFETGATITGWEANADGMLYTATVEVENPGSVTFTIPAGAVQAVDDGQTNRTWKLFVLVLLVSDVPVQ